MVNEHTLDCQCRLGSVDALGRHQQCFPCFHIVLSFVHSNVSLLVTELCDILHVTKVLATAKRFDIPQSQLHRLAIRVAIAVGVVIRVPLQSNRTVRAGRRALRAGPRQVSIESGPLQPNGHDALLMGSGRPLASKHDPTKIGLDPSHACRVVERAAVKFFVLYDIIGNFGTKGLVHYNEFVIVLGQNVLSFTRPHVASLLIVRFRSPEEGPLMIPFICIVLPFLLSSHVGAINV
mmetsp:Transcript_621/g.1117  ORF Transcript_621/g.1117 Transcript_621/m.1117 type:complete len:235 (-) Transcript_621:3-707(-)